MLPDEVREAVDHIDTEFSMGLEPFESAEDRTEFMDQRCFYVGYWEWIAIRAHLLAREAEVERLQAIEKERWDVVATRNAAVMRAERAEALLRECLDILPIHPATHARITAHLSENSRGND